jgi:hypothetical protein
VVQPVAVAAPSTVEEPAVAVTVARRLALLPGTAAVRPVPAMAAGPQLGDLVSFISHIMY